MLLEPPAAIRAPRPRGVSEQELLGLGGPHAGADGESDAAVLERLAGAISGGAGGSAAKRRAAAAARRTPSPEPRCAVHELARAAEKAFASGLGDWHLQPLHDAAPVFADRLLLGPLGPETLATHHCLSEPQALALYGLLHRHSSGFQSEAAALLDGAAHREQLLAALWRGFAQLWDDTVRCTFRDEVAWTAQELEVAQSELAAAREQLDAALTENRELRARCDEFVRSNLDRMLSWRALKAKAEALEAEAATLGATNDELSLRMAATQTRNTQLGLRIEALTAQLDGAGRKLAGREAQLAEAGEALLERDAGLRRWEQQARTAAASLRCFRRGRTRW